MSAFGHIQGTCNVHGRSCHWPLEDKQQGSVGLVTILTLTSMCCRQTKTSQQLRLGNLRMAPFLCP